MTLDEQHIFNITQSVDEINDIMANLVSAKQILETTNSANRNIKDAQNLTMLMSQTTRSIISARVSAEMMERGLRYMRLKPAGVEE